MLPLTERAIVCHTITAARVADMRFVSRASCASLSSSRCVQLAALASLLMYRPAAPDVVSESRVDVVRTVFVVCRVERSAVPVSALAFASAISRHARTLASLASLCSSLGNEQLLTTR